MSDKVVKSPVKKWPGTIAIQNPLSFPQIVAIEDAIQQARELGEDISIGKYHSTLLDAFLDCVSDWNLEGLSNPPVPFPATPRLASTELIAFIIEEVMGLFNGVLETSEE